MIQILLVDDHPSVGEGTKFLIEKEADMTVTLAKDEYQVLKLVDKQSFDVLLFDLYMPNMNGLELSKKILEKYPESVIVIYTGSNLQDALGMFMETCITGLISKTSTQEQIVTAIRCAARGEIVLPVTMFRELFHGRISVSKPMQAVEKQRITDKEKTILESISKGKSNKEIAQDMLISQRSLEYMLTDLFHKFNVRSRVEAVTKAKDLGIIATD